MENKKKKEDESTKKSSHTRKVTKIIKNGFWGTVFTLKTVIFSLLYALFTLLLIGFIAIFSLYYSYSSGFPQANIRSNSTQNVIYDKYGGIIYEGFGAKPPSDMKLNEIPDLVINATLAAEDINFYNHGPIDIRGIGRAAIQNIKSSKKTGFSKVTDLFNEENYTQGGSTITQQLVKNLYLTNERSFDRKMKEIVYSYELEKEWSKDKILEEYLNNVYYGEQALGIKNAAKIFFDKDVKDLDLAEVSMLSGLTAAPSRYSPISGDFVEAKKRQEYVLSKMYNRGFITYDEAKKAAQVLLIFNQKKQKQILRYPYFVDYVKNEVSEKLGAEIWNKGGLKVHTTIDPRIQNIAEANAKKYMKQFAWRRVTNTAIVVLDNQNEGISAMVGGVNWRKSKVNVATSERQPGSSFKPIVYTSGLLSGYSAATRLYDGYVNFGGIPPYAPHNYDGGYHGYLTARRALANSLNIPAVEMAKLAGIPKVLETANKLGITTLDRGADNYGLSIALGSGEVKLFELARAYSVFANCGKMGNFSSITSIVDNEGSTIYRQVKIKEEVIDPKVAYIMASILSDNKARSMIFGTFNPLTLKGRKVAAKTGTTDDYADSWTMGFTPQYTTGVWMGNNDHSKMAHISGIEGAAYIWQDVMKAIHKGLPAKNFAKPQGLTEKYINSYTGTLANGPGYSNILEYFVPGTEPKKVPDYSYLNQFYGWRKY